MSDHADHLTRLRYLRNDWDLAGVGDDLVKLAADNPDLLPRKVASALRWLLRDIETDGIEVEQDPDYDGGEEPDYGAVGSQERAEMDYRRNQELR